MGINGFFRDIKDRGYVQKEKNIKHFIGSKFIVDISIWMYKAKYCKCKNPIIRYVFNRIKYFFKNNIYPVFIFDGIPCKIKKVAKDNRDKEKERKINKIKEFTKRISEIEEDYPNGVILDNNELAIEYQKNIEFREKYNKYLNMVPTKEDILKIKNFLTSIGFPYIVVDNHDAENFCSYIQKNFKNCYVCSTDSDTLITGSTRTISHINIKKDIVLVHYREDVMNSLNFTNEEQLINYAIMIGTDYNKRKYKEGPKKCYNKVLSSNDMGKTEAINNIPNYDMVYNEFKHDYSTLLESCKFLSVDNKKLIKMSLDCMNRVEKL